MPTENNIAGSYEAHTTGRAFDCAAVDAAHVGRVGRADGVAMIAYASRTGTARNLRSLDRAGWRLLVSATGAHRTESFRYALDNGAWTAHQQGRSFDDVAFVRLVEKLGHDADWVVAPDVVGHKDASLAQTLKWLPWCLERCPRVLVGVQDGMVPSDVSGLLSPRVGVAIGGTTDERIPGKLATGWKIDQLTHRVWGRPCFERGAWLHCLRVNSAHRIALCAHAGVDSFDGTSASQYSVSLPRLDQARRQPSLLPHMRGGS